MSTIQERLKELGIELQKVNKPVGSYVPGVRVGKLLYSSGHVPRIDGKVSHKGKMAPDTPIEHGYMAARNCAITCLSSISHVLGGLENIERIVKVNGYVNATPDFTDTPKVLNGASDLLLEIFGEKGKHARTAVGVATLPEGATCEIEMVVEVKEP